MPHRRFDRSQSIIPEEASVLGTHLNPVSAIFRSLRDRQSKGQHCFYQVLVDSLRMIPRTENLDEFWDFLNYIGGAKKLEIVCFMGQSYRNTRHTFELKKPSDEPTMNEEEMNRRVKEEAERWKAALQIEALEAENAGLRATVSQQAATIRELQAELNEVSGKSFDRDNLNVAAVLKHLIVNYPAIQEQFPVLKQIRGMIGLEPAQATEPETKDQP